MSQSKLKQVVVLGAGTGQAQVLASLLNLEVELTAIVNVTDNGGSSKLVREIYQLPQPGDSRNCLQALITKPSLAADLFNTRYTTTHLEGVSLGNLILAYWSQKLGGLTEGLAFCARWLGVEAQVLAVSNSSVEIGAVLDSGQKIIGEWEILDRPNKSDQIVDIFLSEEAAAHQLVVEAIEKADYLIVAPGSLYTGVLPNFLFAGVKSAIAQSEATKLYIANIMVQPGISDYLTMADHLALVEKYAQVEFDWLVVNNQKIAEGFLAPYRKIGSTPLKLGAVPERVKVLAYPLIPQELPVSVLQEMKVAGKQEKWQKWTHLLRHNQASLAQVLGLILA